MQLKWKKLHTLQMLYLINLDIDGNTTRVIIQELQFHPVTDNLLHIDFLEAAVGKVAKLHLPVHIKGNSAGVLAGGKLVVKMRRLRVSGIPAELPNQIDIDISDLQIGKSIKVSDVEGFNFLDAPNTVIVRVKAARDMEALEAEIAEGLEGEEGAEGEGAEGEGAEGEGAPAAEGEGAPAAEGEAKEAPAEA